jgi:tRNA (adenine22-N1)-methyltransferase
LKLSQRLTALASFYEDEHSIWDIGCDHALLGLSFLSAPTVKSIHLVDPSLEVINALRYKIDAHIPNSQKISIHHQKGQQLQLDQHSKCIFIAGMGGAEIMAILHILIPQLSSSDRVVLSPHGKILELRQYLRPSSLRLQGERMLQEYGEFYQLLVLRPDPSLPAVSLYGVQLWQGEVGEAYRRKLVRDLACHQDQPSRDFHQWLQAL